MGRDRFEFEELAVFQRAVDLLAETDELVTHFRGHRRGIGFNAIDAAGSIVHNIAESRGRSTIRDRAHFLDVASGSAHELGSSVCIADRLGIGSSELRARVRSLTMEVIAMLHGMRRRLRSRLTPARLPPPLNLAPLLLAVVRRLLFVVVRCLLFVVDC